VTSRMEHELREQPAVLGRLATAAPALAAHLRTWLQAAEVRSVVLAARGSSDNAARYAQYLLGWQAGLPTLLAAPSLGTIYGRLPRTDGALVVGVSQSGASPDVVGVLEAARADGTPTLAITNDPGSPLAAAADQVVPLGAGAEGAVAATKTFTASCAALALVAAVLGPEDEQDRRLRELQLLPAAAAAVIGAADGPAASAAAALAGVRRATVVGRGLSYGIAFEVALKVRELTGIVAEAYSPPDLLHGPIAALGPDALVLLVAPPEPSVDSVRDLLPALAERGVALLAITDDDDLGSVAPLHLPATSGTGSTATLPAHLAPIVAAIPGQLLALRLAEALGRDVDRPAGLSKVTRTR
jgi:glutamine---fructose-6-phosphate transaminase (isomerizing)